jgi:predicted DNA-binding transcriptional regulator YafY
VRASRLLQLLLVLQRRGRSTAADLAEELEVSVRTVYRDVEALGAAGVPVFAEPGPGGGIQLVDGYQTRLTGLDAPEAEALALASLPDAAQQLGLGAVLAAAQAKVDAALPPELRSRAARVRDRFLVDAPRWFRRDEEVPRLPAVSEAVWSDRRVDLRYRRGERVVRRTASPLGLVLKAGVWYLVAEAGRPATLRTFRVSRIVSVRVRAEPVERPTGFDLTNAWAELGDSFARDLLRVPVRARVRADQLWRLRLALTEVAAMEAIASAGPAGDDGWCEVVIPAETLQIAHEELLRMGDDLEVIEPVELRETIATTARRMADRYRS